METNKDIQALSDDLPQPFAGAITLLETIAKYGMEAAFDDGKPTPNAALCKRFAQDLREVATRQPAPAVSQQAGGAALAMARRHMFSAYSTCLTNGETMLPQEIADTLLAAAHPPADAAPDWDTSATERLRSIVDLLGLQSDMPEDDLTGYEFAVLGVIRAEIKLLKAKADAAPVDAKPVIKQEMREISAQTRAELQRIFDAPSNPVEAAFKEATLANGSQPKEWDESIPPVVWYGWTEFQKGYKAQPSPAQGDALSQEAGGEDWLGRAMDLEVQACRVESQTVQRAMEGAATCLRLMGKRLAQRAASQQEVSKGTDNA